MSVHSIALRSELPSLLVELEMKPGTHARIGSSAKAEISLPLEGLPEFACTLGCTRGGKFYVEDMDGRNTRFITLPGPLELYPYNFELFRPEPQPGGATLSKVAPGAAVPVAEVLISEDDDEQPAPHSMADNLMDTIGFILDRFKRPSTPAETPGKGTDAE